MIYTVTFNPALDYSMRADCLRRGEVNRSSDEEITFGGKGINVSVILARLGVQSRALGFIAGFTGDELDRRLRGIGIDTDFIRLPGGMTRINVKLRESDGTETELNGKGPDIDSGALDTLTVKLGTLTAGDTVVTAGSVPSSLPRDIYEQIAAMLYKKNVRLVTDAEGELLTGVLKYRPFLVKPNIHELSAIFGRPISTRAETEKYAAELQKLGAHNVLVSMGADGALLLDDSGGFHYREAFAGTAVNSVGAGDSMVAGFLAGIGGGYDNALLLGTAAGSATAFSRGLARREDIDALLSRVQE